MGASPVRSDVLTAYARILIQRKARQLCRKPGFSRSDQEDLVQELTLRLLQKADCYDPERGASIDTFADRVINSAVRMILRDRRRIKRAAGLTASSLEGTAIELDGKPMRLVDSISSEDSQRRTLKEPGELTSRDIAELAQLVESLPPDLREIAQRILHGGTVASIAREKRESRRQIYNAIRRAKAYFQEAGFDLD